MQIGAMQPYFFPYLGYFQLIAKCDLFVFLDDVQYIPRGWSNRNRILTNGKATWIRLPVKHASRDATFRQREYLLDEKTRKQVLKQLYHSYHNSPHFESFYPLIVDLLGQSDLTVAKFNIRLIRSVLCFIDLKKELTMASEVAPHSRARGQARIIEICRAAGGDAYINLPGGAALYDPKVFSAAGIQLRFLTPSLPPYQQGRGAFVPGLSIIDPLMWCGPDEVRDMLQESWVSTSGNSSWVS